MSAPKPPPQPLAGPSSDQRYSGGSPIYSPGFYAALVASSNELMSVFSADGRILYASPANNRTFGYAALGDLGASIFDIIHPDDHLTASGLFAEALATPGPTRSRVLRFRTLSGQWRYIESTLTNRLFDPDVAAIIGNGHDITAATHLNRALSTLTRANQVLFSAKTPDDLMTELCRSITDQTGFPLAWIAVSDDESAAALKVRAQAGIAHSPEDLCVDLARASTKDPVGRAALTKTPNAENNLKSLPRAPWVECALALDLNSVIALPFDSYQNHPGVLCIYATDADSFGPAEAITLADLARDLGLGLSRLHALADLEVSSRSNQEAEQRFRLAFESNTSPMLFTDLNDHVIAANEAFCHLVGRPLEELLGNDSSPFTHPEDIGLTEAHHQRICTDGIESLRYTKRYLHPDGHTIIVEVVKSPAKDSKGKTLYYVISERDITEERLLTAKLSHQALHDPLTGLANRALFEERLSQANARRTRQMAENPVPTGALVMIDLDDFKGVNDTYGHIIGDQLLCEIAERLGAVTRSTDTLCRFGGDEFLYLAPDISPEESTALVERLLSVFSAPFVLGDITLTQRASAGISSVPSELTSTSTLLANADLALYESKRTHPGTYSWYSPHMYQALSERFNIAQDLSLALTRSEIDVRYWPIYDLSTAAPVGFEASPYWAHPTKGSLDTEDFLDAAESAGRAIELGDYTLDMILANGSAITKSLGGPKVFSHLTTTQFLDPALATKIERLSSIHALSPDCLVVLVDELALTGSPEALAQAHALNQIGVRLGVENFSIGPSSLTYLAEIRPYLVTLHTPTIISPVIGPDPTALVRAMIGLSHDLGMLVLAQEVSSPADYTSLVALGCDLAEGAHLIAPWTLTEALDTLARS